jgi:hypothetical protein
MARQLFQYQNNSDVRKKDLQSRKVQKVGFTLISVQLGSGDSRN